MEKEINGNNLDFNDLYLNEADQLNSDYLQEFASLLKIKGVFLSVIESISGGGIARKVVELPGCSSYFLGGVVAYHSRLKVNYGLVKPQTIAKYGIISAAVTTEMVDGIKKMTKSDISIASNGIAGPQNNLYSEDQSGTVFLSWNIRDKIKKTKRYKFKGERNEIIDKTVFVALNMCLRYLKMI